MPITADMDDAAVKKVIDEELTDLDDQAAMTEVAKEATPRQVYEVIMPYAMEKRGDEMKEKLAGIEGTVAWHVEGDGGGKWLMTFTDGSLTVAASEEEGTATIKMNIDDWKEMQTGELPPQQAFMMGKMIVEGDMSIMMQLQTVMGG